MRVANLVVNFKNCGTGAGGFQQGNTCASGSGEGSQTPSGQNITIEEISGYFPTNLYDKDNVRNRNSPLALLEQSEINELFELEKDSSKLDQLILPPEVRDFVYNASEQDRKDLDTFIRSGFRYMNANPQTDREFAELYKRWDSIDDYEIRSYGLDVDKVSAIQKTLENARTSAEVEVYNYLFYPETNKLRENRVSEYLQTDDWKKTEDYYNKVYAERGQQWPDDARQLELARSIDEYHTARIRGEKARDAYKELHKMWTDRRDRIESRLRNRKLAQPTTLYRMMRLEPSQIEAIRSQGELTHRSINSWTPQALKTETISQANVVVRMKNATEGMPLVNNWGSSGMKEREVLRPSGTLKVTGIKRASVQRPENMTEADFSKWMAGKEREVFLIDVEEIAPRKKSMLSWKNCGTGAGGFQSGNTCASGGSAGSSEADVKVVEVEYNPKQYEEGGALRQMLTAQEKSDAKQLTTIDQLRAQIGDYPRLKDESILDYWRGMGFRAIGRGYANETEAINDVEAWWPSKDYAIKNDPMFSGEADQMVQNIWEIKNEERQKAYEWAKTTEEGKAETQRFMAEEQEDEEGGRLLAARKKAKEAVAERLRPVIAPIYKELQSRGEKLSDFAQKAKFEKPIPLYRQIRLSKDDVDNIVKSGKLEHKNISSWTTKTGLETVSGNVLVRLKDATGGLVITDNFATDPSQTGGYLENEILLPKGELRVVGVRKFRIPEDDPFERRKLDGLEDRFVLDVEEVKSGAKKSFVRKNCGTGAGGFQEGNTCASGDGAGEQTTTSALGSKTTTLEDVAKQNKFAMESRRTSDGREIPFYVANNDAFDTTAFFEQEDAGRIAEDFYNNNPVTNERTKLLDWVSTAEKTGVANYQDDPRFTRMQEVEAGFAIWGSNLYDVVNGDITLQESAQQNKMLYSSHAYLFDRFNGTGDSEGDIQMHQDVVVPKLREQLNNIATESKLKGDGVIFRGMRLSEDAVNNIIAEGELRHTKLNSWTTDSNIARNFTVDTTEGAQQNDKKVVVRLAKPKVGMPSLPSGENAEAEVLRPATNLKVERVIRFDKRTSADDPDYLIEVSEDSRFTKSRKTRLVVKNCGTGAGGFQQGNTCASGSGGGASANARNTPTTINTERAKKYVADSALKEIGWHWTARQNTTAIAEEGFKIPKNPTFSSIRVWGEGVYFGLGEQDVYSDLVKGQPYERLRVVADIRNPITIENATSRDLLLRFDGAAKAIRLAGGTNQDVTDVERAAQASFDEGKEWRKEYVPAYQKEVEQKISERAKKMEHLSKTLNESELWEKIDNRMPTYDEVLTRVKTALREKHNATDEDIEAFGERKRLTDALLKKIPMPRFTDQIDAALAFHATEKLKELGVDAIIVKQKVADRNVGGSQVVVFDPNRVKVVRDE